MATVTISAGTAVTLDPGTAYSLQVANTGNNSAIVNGVHLHSGQSRVIYPSAETPVAALSILGTTLDVTTSLPGAAADIHLIDCGGAG